MKAFNVLLYFAYYSFQWFIKHNDCKINKFFLKKRPFKIAFQIKSIYFIIQHVISKSHAKIYIVVDNKNELIGSFNRKTVVKVFILSFVNLLIFQMYLSQKINIICCYQRTNKCNIHKKCLIIHINRIKIFVSIRYHQKSKINWNVLKI